jgi:hypothetical protein
MTAALDLEFGLRSAPKSAPSLSPRQRFAMLLSGVVLLAGVVIVATFGPTSRSATVPPFEGSVLLANGSGNPLYFNLATRTVTYGVSGLPELIGITRQRTSHIAALLLGGNTLAYSTGPNVGAGYLNYLTSAGLIAGNKGRSISMSTPLVVGAYADGKDSFFVKQTSTEQFEVTKLVTSQVIAALQNPTVKFPTATTFSGSLCSPCVQSSLSGDSHFQDGIAVGLNGRLWYLKKDGVHATDGKKETDSLKTTQLGALEAREGKVTLATPKGFSTFASPNDQSLKELPFGSSDLQKLGKVLSIVPVSTADRPAFLYNSENGWLLARVSQNSDQVLLTGLATGANTSLAGAAIIQNSLYSEMRSKTASTKFVRFDVGSGAPQVVFTPTSAMKFSGFGSGNPMQIERSRSVVVFNDVAATLGLYVSSSNEIGTFMKSPASQVKPSSIGAAQTQQHQVTHHPNSQKQEIRQDSLEDCAPVAPQNPLQPTLNGDASASSAVIDWAQPDNGGCPTFELLTQAQPSATPAPLDGTDPKKATGWTEHGCGNPTSISTAIEGTPGWECELIDLSRATSYQVVVAVQQADVWKYSDPLSFETQLVFVPPPTGVSASFVQPVPTRDGYWAINDSLASTAVGRPDLVITPEQCNDGLSPHPIPSGIFGVALTNPSSTSTSNSQRFDISTHPSLSGQEMKFAIKAVIKTGKGSIPSATVRTGCAWSPPNVACAQVRPLGATEAAGSSTRLSVSAPAVPGCVLGQGEVTVQYQVNAGSVLPCGTASYSGSATQIWPFGQNCQIATDPNEISSGLKRLYIHSRIQMPVGAAPFPYPEGPAAGQPGSSWVRVNGTDKKPFSWPTDSRNIAARASVVQPSTSNPNQFASIQILIPSLLDPGQDPDPIRIDERASSVVCSSQGGGSTRINQLSWLPLVQGANGSYTTTIRDALGATSSYLAFNNPQQCQVSIVLTDPANPRLGMFQVLQQSGLNLVPTALANLTEPDLSWFGLCDDNSGGVLVSVVSSGDCTNSFTGGAQAPGGLQGTSGSTSDASCTALRSYIDGGTAFPTYDFRCTPESTVQDLIFTWKWLGLIYQIDTATSTVTKLS